MEGKVVEVAALSVEIETSGRRGGLRTFLAGPFKKKLQFWRI